MAKANFLERYSLIYNKLLNQKLSINELHAFLHKQSDERHRISKRTIARDIADIQTHFGVTINYNRKDDCYEIEDDATTSEQRRTIEAFELYNSLQYSSKIGNKVFFDDRLRTGIDHMHGILYAIDNNLEITFSHKNYWNDIKTDRHVQPIAIKEAQQRWYLICFDTKKNDFRNFGLDRISNFKITDQNFTPKKFDVQKNYKYAFGIETNIIAEKIILRVTQLQSQYIKSLPIHYSQTQISENDDFVFFEYFMHPTYDLQMEILKHNDQVCVLEPQSLRTEILKKLKNSLYNYENI